MVEPKKIYYNPNRGKVYSARYYIGESALFVGDQKIIEVIKAGIALKIADYIVNNMQYEIQRDTKDSLLLEVTGTTIVYELSEDEKAQQSNYISEMLSKLRKEYELYKCQRLERIVKESEGNK